MSSVSIDGHARIMGWDPFSYADPLSQGKVLPKSRNGLHFYVGQFFVKLINTPTFASDLHAMLTPIALHPATSLINFDFGIK